jgi:2-dehydropantoate 2-reductase
MNSGIAATTGLSAKQGLANPLLRSFMIDLATEAVSVAAALGHRLEKIGKIDAGLFAKAAAHEGTARAELDLRLEAQSDSGPAERLSSMGQDVQKGRRTEIDFLNGYVVEKGREVGIPTPANARVVEIVRRIERGSLAPDIRNVLEMA